MTTRGPLFENMRDALHETVGASRKEQCDASWAKTKGDIKNFKLLHDYHFYANYDKFDVDQRGVGQTIVKPKAPVPRPSREASKKAVEAAMTSMAQKIILMNLRTPTGKALVDSTGAECRKFEGFYSAVGHLLKPTQVVGKHLTEKDLQNIWRRCSEKERSTTRTATQPEHRV